MHRNVALEFQAHPRGTRVTDDLPVAIFDNHTWLEIRNGKRLGFHFQAVGLDNFPLEYIVLTYLDRRTVRFYHPHCDVFDLHCFGERDIELAVFLAPAISEDFYADIVPHR